jgi:translation initiation factor IF-3
MGNPNIQVFCLGVESNRLGKSKQKSFKEIVNKHMAFKPSNSPPAPGGVIITANANKPSGPKPAGSTAFVPRSPRPYPPRGGQNFNKDDKDDVRLNERIRVPQVRLIDENGGQVGIVQTSVALQMARDKGLDLMEVSATASPPVCKICDYGKFKYEKKKKEHQARKNQVVVKVKEVQLRPHTEEHDLEYKIKNCRGFIEEGDKAKITILFRGREIAHTEPGYKMANHVIDSLKDIALVEAPPKLEGKKLIFVLAPNPASKKK